MPWMRILTGALAGGLLGALLGRSRACHAGQCNLRVNRAAGILAGAVFGAALAFYLAGS